MGGLYPPEFVHNMTSECLDRLRMYVNGTRKQDVLAARNSRLNGYSVIASDHENRVIIADLILKDLASEGVQDANHS
jgi:hypothetical protein